MDLSEFRGLALAGFDLAEVVDATVLRGGGNNRVYCLRLRSGEKRVLKFYFRHERDLRDRLGAEFGALKFLWQQGVRNVPEPFACDVARGCALYSFVEGTAFSPPATLQDIDQAVAFTAELARLRTSPGAQTLPLASEACVRWSEVQSSITSRVGRIRDAIGDAGDLRERLARFLDGAFESARQEISGWVNARRVAVAGRDPDVVPVESRTLSPSDFGFHNGIRGLSGHWIFQDFEYFGWDDPSKLVADFMLHPGMRLDPELQAAFVQRVLQIFERDVELRSRLAIAYPLYGLKWCMILLNEFVPTSRARRGFAAGSQTETQLRSSQLRQLEKAEQLLMVVRSNYGKFSSSL